MIIPELYTTLASNILNNSIKLKSGENIQLDLTDVPTEMAVALVNTVNDIGGNPIVNLINSKVTHAIVKHSTSDHKDLLLDVGMYTMTKMDAYLAIRGSVNKFGKSDISTELMGMSKHLRPITNYRVKNTKWCVLIWPTDSVAQAAEMSTGEFEELYFKSCCFDYSKMAENAKPLKDLMDRTDQVRIVGNGTHIEFSIKGINSVICSGTYNIPDGEVFTAPVKDSVNGTIKYNCKTNYQGAVFDGIQFTVRDGNIITATCEDGDEAKLNDILNTDNGARYFGEFALGINPMITRGMNDILFDEKIGGSFHLTPGKCYDEADNGNDSAIHWDLVCIQTPEYGMGDIYFDDVLIRRDGQFILDILKGLN